jgi:hypothetical protein
MQTAAAPPGKENKENKVLNDSSLYLSLVALRMVAVIVVLMVWNPGL